MPLQFPTMFLGSSDLVPPITDYCLWLDFGDMKSMYLANGTNPDANTPVGTYISQITDKSQFGQNALAFPTSGTSGFIFNRPLAGKGLNGRSTVETNGTGCMSGAWQNWDNLTMYVIFQCYGNNVTDKGRIFSQLIYDGVGETYVPLVYNSTIAITTLSTGGNDLAGVTLGVNVWRRIKHVKMLQSAVNSVGSVDSIVGAIHSGVITNNKVGYSIGGQVNPDGSFVNKMVRGLYAEIIAFPRVLTKSEDAQMASYFNGKWGSVLPMSIEHAMVAAEMSALPKDSTWDLGVTTKAVGDLVAFKYSGVGVDSIIDWGDGTPAEHFTAAGTHKHNYAVVGSYTIKISASFTSGGDITLSFGQAFVTSTSIIPRFDGEAMLFKNTFKGCTGLKTVPEDLFMNYPNVGAASFGGTFFGSGLTAIPEGLFKHQKKISGSNCFFTTFSGCRGLTSIPANLFKSVAGITDHAFNGTFSNTSITSVPAGLFDSVSPTSHAFLNTFLGCKNLVHAPADLFKNMTLAAPTESFDQVFYGAILDNTDYGNMLVSLNTHLTQSGLKFNVGTTTKYPAFAATARAALVARGWTLVDGGPV